MRECEGNEEVFTIFKNQRFLEKVGVLSKHFYVVVVISLLSLDSLKTLKRYTNSFKMQISEVF